MLVEGLLGTCSIDNVGDGMGKLNVDDALKLASGAAPIFIDKIAMELGGLARLDPLMREGAPFSFHLFDGPACECFGIFKVGAGDLCVHDDWGVRPREPLQIEDAIEALTFASLVI